MAVVARQDHHETLSISNDVFKSSGYLHLQTEETHVVHNILSIYLCACHIMMNREAAWVYSSTSQCETYTFLIVEILRKT